MIQLPQYQPPPPPATDSEQASVVTVLMVAAVVGVAAAIGGYHAGVTQNEMALAHARQQTQAAQHHYANCKAWVETQNTRVTHFYREYMGIEQDKQPEPANP